MKFFSSLVVSSFLVGVYAATVATTTKATVGTIMKDLTKISHLYTKTVAAIAAFPQSGTQGATVIHDHEATIETLFGDVIDNLEILPSPAPEKSARKIIEMYSSFAPTIIESLDAINDKASDFEAMNVAPMISNDLLVVKNPCARFAELIVAMTPADMMEDVNTMFDQLTTARNDASAALASVMSA